MRSPAIRTMAADLVAAGAHDRLAVKENQPTLCGEIESDFDTAPAAAIETLTLVDTGHGRLQTHRPAVSRVVDWRSSPRPSPGEPRVTNLTALAMGEATVEKADETTIGRRFDVSSAALSVARFAHASRGHWGMENQLHWVLDVQVKEDHARLRAGHGAKNRAVVRPFAINLLRTPQDRRSLKTRRKRAGWDPEDLRSILVNHRC